MKDQVGRMVNNDTYMYECDTDAAAKAATSFWDNTSLLTLNFLILDVR